MKNLLLISIFGLFGLSAGAQDSLGCDLIADFTYTVSGETLYLTNTSTDEPVWSFYDWSVDGLSSGLENPTFPTTDFEASELVCLTVFDSLEDCIDTYCLTIYFEDDTLVEDSTECELIADFTYTVSGGMLNLTNTSTGEPLWPYYSWMVDGLSSGLENPSFSTADFEESEEVCLTVYDSLEDCMDTYCMTIYFEGDTLDDDTTTVECDLEADFTYSYEDGVLTLTNTSTGEFGTTTYNWNVDGLSSSDENPTFPTADFEESEVICLTVYSIDSAFGCIDTVCYTFFFDDSTGVDSTANIISLEKLAVEIYPNPAHDALNISISNGNGNQQIIIYNTIGEMVRMDQVGLNNSQTTIDVSDLPKGLYIINVIDAENPANSIQEKFIKN
ncbi:MAG: T9SS type A sorting domain-containing protein [Crocinitomix sp.]|nr:T9SS type A sorting domain-containing protein [Crocinitomix sp.]